MKRALLMTVAALALLLPATAFTVLSPTKLNGSTGPGLTITITKAGKKVTRLKPGRYTITVRDRSTAHNFVLTGPGIRNRTITGLSYTGTKKVTVALKRGRYEYYCTPHRSIGMQGFFRVR